MHSRRLACLLLGLWLGGGLVMALLALDGSRSVERVLAHPDPVLNLQIQHAGLDQARALLERQAARQSRFYFEAWAVAQIVMGGGFFFYLLFATGEGKQSLFLALWMLAAVLGQQMLLMPGLFPHAPANPRAILAGEASMIPQTGYWCLEAGKLAGALLLAFRFLRRHGPSGHARQEVDMVDKADYRHVNR